LKKKDETLIGKIKPMNLVHGKHLIFNDNATINVTIFSCPSLSNFGAAESNMMELNTLTRLQDCIIGDPIHKFLKNFFVLVASELYQDL